MKKIKKLIIEALVFCLAGNYLFSNENFKFSLTPEFGFLNGHVYEYVFDEPCKNTDSMVSMLDWQIKNVPYVQLNANTDIFKYINFSATGRLGYAVLSGYMQDYDWLNSLGGIYDDVPYNWTKEDPTELTNYSKHTNMVSQAHSTQLSLGLNIVNNKNFKLTRYYGFKYDYIRFDAFDGYIKYKINDFKTINYYGRCISYAQDYYAFIFGVKANLNLVDKFYLSCFTQISPELCVNYSQDCHWGRNVIFYDDIKNVFQFKWGFTTGYNVTSRSRIGLSYNYQFIPVSKGPDYKDSEKLYPVCEGGTSSKVWSLGLNYTYSL